MKTIDLGPSQHSTLIEVQPAPKWVLPLALVVWLAIGVAVYGVSDFFPYVYGACFGAVMLAAVASYPKFFLARDR